MGKLIFILGGVKSGKSRFALQLSKKSGKKVTFIATALPIDKEMKERIKEHKKIRPEDWQTLEAPDNLDKNIKGGKNQLFLIDCLTIYVSHLMDWPETKILKHMEKIIEAVKKSSSDIIVVSNEVGCGVHPETKLGREYRDVLGKANQIFARAADEFYTMLAGIPVNIKDMPKNSKAI